MRIEFEVLGKPATQGSKTMVPIIRCGKVVRHAIKESCKGLGPWRDQVAHKAAAAYSGELLDGPLVMVLLFERPRPKSHFGTGRNANRLKQTAPKYPTPKPDSIKLARAVEDALSKVLYVDDSQIVEHHIRKRYGQFYRLSVTVETIGR